MPTRDVYAALEATGSAATLATIKRSCLFKKGNFTCKLVKIFHMKSWGFGINVWFGLTRISVLVANRRKEIRKLFCSIDVQVFVLYCDKILGQINF